MDQPTANTRPRDRPPEASRKEADQAANVSARQTSSDARAAEVGRLGQRRSTEVRQNDTTPNNTAESVRNDHRRDTVGLPPRPDTARNPDRQRLAERLERIENPPSSRDALRGRLNQLEPGHPSSPWHEDGSPRPPAPRLSDLERLKPPLNDSEYAEHKLEIADRLREAHAEGRSTSDQNTINPDKDIWTAERIARQDDILNEIYAGASDVPCDGKAIIAGGLGGSGKTTILERHAGIDLSNYLTINPDDIKERMVEHKMLPAIPGLSPMETSSLGHEESSYIARRLANRAYAEGKNIIWDITMSQPGSGTGRVEELRAAGYQVVDGVFADIPIETSVARAETRHRRGHDAYLAGEGMGGRYVPPEIIRSQTDSHFSSVNRREFENTKPLFDRWIIYDNSVDRRPAVALENSHDNSSNWSHGNDQ